MNLSELAELVEDMLTEAEAIDVDPSEIEVKIAYQPNYPLTVGTDPLEMVMSDEDGVTVYVPQGTGGGDYLSGEACEQLGWR